MTGNFMAERVVLTPVWRIRRPIMLNAAQTPEYADIRKAGHEGGDFLFVPR